MPTYQYRCTTCRREFEELQAITAAPLTDCPKCDGNVERVISGGGGFLLKGTGFYKTDYRDKRYKDASKKDNDSALPKSTSSDKKSDSSKKTDSKKSATG